MIDVGNVGDPNVRLVVAQHLEFSELFATLSHCWGKSLSLTLCNGSFEEFRSGIEHDRLPKTFREAIYVVRKYGLRYLWIDSLCKKLALDTQSVRFDIAWEINWIERVSFKTLETTGSLNRH